MPIAVCAVLLSGLTLSEASMSIERQATVGEPSGHGRYGRASAGRPGTSANVWSCRVEAPPADDMREDADEAVRRFATESFVTSAPALMQGVARVISGDHDGGDAALEDAASVAEKVGADEDLALALCERALVAFERGEWDRAEIVANQAHAALRRARREESYAAPLVAAAQARAVLHRGDLAAVRQHLVSAQRLRPLLTYALPHLAIQARIELARVYVALADLPGARTLMREIDDLLRRRPEMGTLVGQAGTLRAQLSKAAW